MSPQRRSSQTPGGPDPGRSGLAGQAGREARTSRRRTPCSPRCCGRPASCWPCAARSTRSSWSASCSGTWWGAARHPCQRPARRDGRAAGRRGAGRLRGRPAQPGGARPAVRHRLPRHPPAGGQGRTRRPRPDRERRAVPRLGRAPGRGDLGRVLHQPRLPRRPGRGHLRVQLRRGRAARAGHRGGLQRRRDDPGRLGDLAGRQAARPLPRGERPARGRTDARHAFRQVDARARPAHAGDRAGRDRRGDGPVGQRVLPLLPRVHPGPDQGPAALPRPYHLRRDRAAAARRGAGTAGPCSPPSSWPPTRPRTCPTAVRPRTARTGSSTTAATGTSGGRCG